jgi:hypothetical protein
MDLLINVFTTLYLLFGLGLLFSPARGSFIAAVVCIGAAVIAYDERSFLALVIGFGLLWVLRLMGIEQR